MTPTATVSAPAPLRRPPTAQLTARHVPTRPTPPTHSPPRPPCHPPTLPALAPLGLPARRVPPSPSADLPEELGYPTVNGPRTAEGGCAVLVGGAGAVDGGVTIFREIGECRGGAVASREPERSEGGKGRWTASGSLWRAGWRGRSGSDVSRGKLRRWRTTKRSWRTGWVRRCHARQFVADFHFVLSHPGRSQASDLS